MRDYICGFFKYHFHQIHCIYLILMLGRSGQWGDHVTLQAAADNVSAAIWNSLLLLFDPTNWLLFLFFSS